MKSKILDNCNALYITSNEQATDVDCNCW